MLMDGVYCHLMCGFSDLQEGKAYDSIIKTTLIKNKESFLLISLVLI